MDTTEFIKALQQSLQVLTGGLVAIIGAVVQNRLTANREKTKIRLEKLEATYVLCQSTYDGHLREINNAKSLWKNGLSGQEYLKNRHHPGAEMSELKMLVRCYFPQMDAVLSPMAAAHADLKKTFVHLDDAVRLAQPHTQADWAVFCTQADEALDRLGQASMELKNALASVAAKSTH